MLTDIEKFRITIETLQRLQTALEPRERFVEDVRLLEVYITTLMAELVRLQKGEHSDLAATPIKKELECK